MELLGALGLDLKLLIAQIINFGLLLVILKLYVYNPLLTQVEENEAELSQARILAKDIKQQQAELEKRGREQLESNKQSARKSLEEAEQIAKQIKDRARQEAKRLTQRLSDDKDRAEATLQATLQKKARHSLAKQANTRLKEETLSYFTPTALQALQASYLLQMEHALSHLSPDHRSALESNPPLIMQSYPAEVTPEQQQNIEHQLRVSLSREHVNLTVETNPNLLVGYRLIMPTLDINFNLSSDIDYALTPDDTTQE